MTPGSSAAEIPAACGRVWVVDDSPLQTERARRLLAASHSVDTFNEGAQLLERISEGDLPDLLLLDWQMPGVSGLEVCQFLRGRYDEVTLPILMLTSRGAKEDFTEGLSAGANDYVAKPYDDAELLARVRGLVRTRQLARAMREREEWFATTLLSIGDGVIATDPGGRVTFFNRAAEKLTGWSSEEALGLGIAQIFRFTDEHERAAQSVPVPGREGEASHALLIRKDGSRLPIENNLGPIGPGGTMGAVVTFRDVSARIRAAAEAARRADFEEQLIGIVSHDLRNPLNVIGLATHTLLAKTVLDERANKVLQRIRASADSATRLVNDLLDFTQARLGSGIPVRRQRIDLREVVRQVLDEIDAAHAGRQVTCAASGDSVGEWDPDRIAQALLNLVSNALKYGQSEGVVSVRVQGAPDVVTIEVHNAGNPIAPELLPVLFEPMRRGGAQKNDAARSVGLGLYIVKHILDAHGGSIEVQSTESQGTTFSMRLLRSA